MIHRKDFGITMGGSRSETAGNVENMPSYIKAIPIKPPEERAAEVAARIGKTLTSKSPFFAYFLLTDDNHTVMHRALCEALGIDDIDDGSTDDHIPLVKHDAVMMRVIERYGVDDQPTGVNYFVYPAQQYKELLAMLLQPVVPIESSLNCV